MTIERRLTTLLLVLALIAVPAAALRAFCVGNSCQAHEQRTDPVPFCSLDRRMRELLTAGFYEGRSPDVLGVTREEAVTFHADPSLDIPWPSTTRRSMDVPVVFFGPAATGNELPADLGLDQIAPTLEPLLGFERPFADVRSGRAIAGALRAGAQAPLAVIVVWRGVGSTEIERAHGSLWLLAQIEDAGGAREVSAGVAQAGSIPLDPAAVLTTIGTGGLPSEHGITGTNVGTEDGVAEAFSPRAPGTVIAALGDDLDEATDGHSLIGLVAAGRTDRGLIGKDWYGDEDDETVIVDRRDPAGTVARLLDEGWGQGGAPDLLGVTLGGDVGSMDETTRRIVDEVDAVAPGAVVVVTATGSLAVEGTPLDDRDVAARVEAGLPGSAPVIAASAAGGFFLDDAAAAARGLTSQQVADAMGALVADDGVTPMFGDTFPSFTVRFGRYC